jgi:hypothetical protein
MGALVGLCAICSAATGPEAQYVDAASGTDWPGFGRTYGEQHFSPLTQIDNRNVGRLGLAWYIDLPPGNAATEPVEVDGVGARRHAGRGMPGFSDLSQSDIAAIRQYIRSQAADLRAGTAEPPTGETPRD